MTSKPVTPEAEVPDQAIGRDNPDTTMPENDAEAQHDNHGDDAQSPQSTSSDKPTQTLATTEDDDAGTSGEDLTREPTREPTADASGMPPLPDEPLPSTQEQDDGWDCHWDAAHQAWFFHNHITNESTWENPRVPSQAQASTTETNTQLQTPPATAVPPMPPVNERLPAGGYNPAIHGDYDPNAWYAKNDREEDEPDVPVMDTATAYAAIGSFNRFTGRWQGDDQNPDRHNDEAKSRRQMNAFFDVDAAANAHDGRSLKAERSGKKPTKSELKHFKEKRRAKKEEKRRAWLRD
ncbi:hypothetical protein ONZ43_g5568 [Nemania bipapillata]|uniref:Uncharacterized protein n=1 Tax=Nemania bipapillata TaxID=110536 RepID=A0ACC2I934_9PEZI|nr:hypothetical protein ONZ43_g5568 [Nemania bipapillata]